MTQIIVLGHRNTETVLWFWSQNYNQISDLHLNFLSYKWNDSRTTFSESDIFCGFLTFICHSDRTRMTDKSLMSEQQEA